MTRMTAKDFDQELLDLYDFYAHGKITKREFLDRAGKYTVAGVTATALLGMLSPIMQWPNRCHSMILTSRLTTSRIPRPMAQAMCAAIWCARPRRQARCLLC